MLYVYLYTKCILVHRHTDEVTALPKCDEEKRYVIENIYKCACVG